MTLPAAAVPAPGPGQDHEKKASYYCRKCYHNWQAPPGRPDHVSCPVCGSYWISMRAGSGREYKPRKASHTMYKTNEIKKERGI